MKEIEIKIKLAERAALEKKVLDLGAQKLAAEEGIEHDIMYNNSAGEFYFGNPRGKHLRLRRAPYGNLLTYKENPESRHEYLLQRTEIQTKVESFETADLILRKLGFFPYTVKEKHSTKYRLDGFVLEFHRLPFLGEFLEIEGEEIELKKILPKLGLKLEQGINRGYNRLFYEYCQKQGWPVTTPLTFEQEAKSLQK